NQAAAAGRVWLAKRPAPINPRDVLSFAEALADAGSDEAHAFIEKMRATQAGEAATIEALLRVRQGRPDEAAAALLAAYTAFRSDAWPLARVQLRSFDLAVEILGARPGHTTPFFDALKTGPFPGYLMEAARRQMLVRLELRRWQNGEGTTNIGYALLEPWGFWTGDYLKSRYTFYKRTGLGDAVRARRELESFLESDTSPFDRDLEPAKPATPPAATAAR
ncbi:MAG: hypothetical protein ABMA01_02810, partial [Chthoniobacteraceae bacterium]